MNRVKIYQLIIVLLIAVSSCTKKSASIDVSKLQSPCDHIDALIIVYEEMIDIRNGEEASKLDEKRWKQFETVAKKGMEIENHAKENEVDNIFLVGSCPNYNKYKELHFKAFR